MLYIAPGIGLASAALAVLPSTAWAASKIELCVAAVANERSTVDANSAVSVPSDPLASLFSSPCAAIFEPVSNCAVAVLVVRPCAAKMISVGASDTTPALCSTAVADNNAPTCKAADEVLTSMADACRAVVVCRAAVAALVCLPVACRTSGCACPKVAVAALTF